MLQVVILFERTLAVPGVWPEPKANFMNSERSGTKFELY
jgi:hypothetical protein